MNSFSTQGTSQIVDIFRGPRNLVSNVRSLRVYKKRTLSSGTGEESLEKTAETLTLNRIVVYSTFAVVLVREECAESNGLNKDDRGSQE